MYKFELLCVGVGHGRRTDPSPSLTGGFPISNRPKNICLFLLSLQDDPPVITVI